MGRWLWCLLLWALLPSTASHAAPAVSFDTHYVQISNAAAGGAGDQLQAVQARNDWVPYRGVLALGYDPAPFWVRVTIRSGGQDGPLVLRLRPSFLDDVSVYSPNIDGGYRVQKIGDQQTTDAQALHDAALSVDLDFDRRGGEHQVFIRVQTTSARMVGLQVLGLVEAERARALENTLMGLYFGIMLCLLAWAGSHAVLDRDPVFSWYTAYEAASMLMNFGLLGYARLYLPAGWSADLWSTAFVLSISVLAPAFHLSLLKSVMAPARLPGMIRWTLLLAMALAVGNLLRAPMGQIGPALEANANIVSLLSMFLAVLVVVTGLRQPKSPLRRLLMGYVLLCLFTLGTLLPLLGVLQGGSWTLFSTSVHGLMVALLLAAMLMVRGREIKRQAEMSRQQVLQEQARTRQAQSERDEKDRFLSMLTHELRTPLSVIRMVIDGVRRREEAAGSQRQLDLARSAVLDIDQVIEATVQVDRLERRVLDSRRVACDLGELAGLCATAAGESARARIRYTRPVTPVEVLSDPVLLRLILSNLLDNALKYSPPRSMVDLEVMPAPGAGSGGPVLRVCNLPGRAGRPDPHRVFGKYYRSEGAQHSTGSGQGLYLVDGLARHLGLTAAYVPGSGEDPAAPVCFELRWGEPGDAAVDPDRRGS